jgi:hypothetical protein
LGLGVAGKERE